jgi:hypothetical protein
LREWVAPSHSGGNNLLAAASEIENDAAREISLVRFFHSFTSVEAAAAATIKGLFK